MTHIGRVFLETSAHRMQGAIRGRLKLYPFRLCASGDLPKAAADGTWLAVMHGGAGMSVRTDSKPSREQFAIGPYQVQHIPTGAKFGAYPGENDLCYINWGRLGELCAAQDYCDELKTIARELLRERAKY